MNVLDSNHNSNK